MKSLWNGIFSVIRRFLVALLSTLGVATLFGFILEKMEAIVNSRLFETLGKGTVLFTAIIGTPLHETAHWLGCKLFGFKVLDVELLRPLKYRQDGVLGYVEYSMNPNNLWQKLGSFFVGIAPMILGGIFILIVLRLLKPEIALNIKDKVSSVSKKGEKAGFLAVSFAAFCGFWKGLFSLKKWGWLRGIICLYIVMSISMHMTISEADVEGAKVGIWIVLAIYGLFALITAMIGCDYIVPGAKTAAFLSAFFSIGLFADALLLVIALIFSGGKSGTNSGLKIGIFNKVDLNKYVIVNCEGYEHYGTLSVDFDIDKFVKRYGKRLERNAKNDLSEFFGIDLNQMDFELGIAEGVADIIGTPKPDKEERLSNGEIVNLSWDPIFDDPFDSLGFIEAVTNLDFKYKDISYSVEGLTVTETFDPFPEAEVDIEGVSGKATFSFVTGSTETKYDIQFSPKEKFGLKNGDKVTVEVSVGNIETYMKSHNSLPYPSEKTYEISGLPYYAKSTKEIEKDLLDEVDSLAMNVALSSADTWVEECKIEEAKCIGHLFVTYDNYFPANKYVSVIKIHAKGSFDEKLELDYYCPVEYTDFLISNGSSEYSKAGKVEDSSRIEKEGPFIGSSGKEYSKLFFTGYSTIDELVNHYEQTSGRITEKELNIE